MHFSMSKWYFDVVSAGGEVGIAYQADIRLGRLHRCMSGVQSGDGAWHFSSERVPAPVFDGDVLHWESAPLNLAVDVARRTEPVEHRLMDAPEGRIAWRCHAPRAHVRLQHGTKVLEGEGYAEELVMTVLPWRIPADEIRWGRFHGRETDLVWIDWRGEKPTRLVIVDGTAVQAAYVGEQRIVFGDRALLQLTTPETIDDTSLGALLVPLRWLRPILNPIARVHQTRWKSHGELYRPGQDSVGGVAIHELVRRT